MVSKEYNNSNNNDNQIIRLSKGVVVAHGR